MRLVSCILVDDVLIHFRKQTTADLGTHTHITALTRVPFRTNSLAVTGPDSFLLSLLLSCHDLGSTLCA